MTPLDQAHAAMDAAPDDDAARLAFHDRLASAELYLLLIAEPEGDAPLDPRLFETTQGSFVLVFDRVERLAEFAEGSAPTPRCPGVFWRRCLRARGSAWR